MNFKVNTMKTRNLLILAVLWLFTLVTVAASFDWTSILLLAVMFLVTYSSIRRGTSAEYTVEPTPEEPDEANDE